MKQEISVKRLCDETAADYQLKHIEDEDGWHSLCALPTHRDDCWLFVLVESGCGGMDVDFERVELSAGQLCVLRPAQVHRDIDGRDVKAWVARVAPNLVPPDCSATMEEALLTVKTPVVGHDLVSQMVSILGVLKQTTDSSDLSDANRGRVGRSLLEAFIGLVAAACARARTAVGPPSAGGALYCRFRLLLSREIRQSRSAAYYAQRLCVTPGYLNEVVRRHSGSCVSHWIREATVLEAKRMLCFTELSVKEIAYALGYDDNAYFGRYFRRATGMTPAAFRAGYL